MTFFNLSSTWMRAFPHTPGTPQLSSHQAGDLTELGGSECLELGMKGQMDGMSSLSPQGDLLEMPLGLISPETPQLF